MKKERYLLIKLTDLQTVSLSKKLAHVLSCIFFYWYSASKQSHFIIFLYLNHLTILNISTTGNYSITETESGFSQT